MKNLRIRYSLGEDIAMSKEQIELLKKIAMIFGISILIIASIVGLNYFAFWLKTDAYFNSAENIIKNSPYCKDYRNINISKDNSFSKKMPQFFNTVFKASDKNTDYYILFVNLSGKYGTYQAVFLYSSKKFLNQSNLRLSLKKTHTIFCGILGPDGIDKLPAHYGISDFLIKGQITKIEKIFNK